MFRRPSKEGHEVDIFDLNARILDDYRSFSSSFIEIMDDRIRGVVDKAIGEGLLWPDPLIQLNPSFESGGKVSQLVKEGTLHPECERVFRIDKRHDSDGSPMTLHKHQAEAIHAARSGNSYVLTTGTGSGKSLAYIIPIVDFVLKSGSGKGIRAIVVYPMNALANSQYNELEKFLKNGYPDGKGPVTFDLYTGQEDDEKREEIMANPPDILLTNYMMLEMILTRPRERTRLVAVAHGLRFLVLDELHTYRGRQGADVAMLVRRTKQACKSQVVQCVGTSATLAGPGSYEEQKREVARVASQLFGEPVKPECVIGESLRRLTPDRDLKDSRFIKSLRTRVVADGSSEPRDYSEFVLDPLSIWIESTFGVTRDEASGRLVRAKPKSIRGEEGAAKELAELTDLPVEDCERAIRSGLLMGYRHICPETGFPAFAFRLHQFFRSGDTVYASIEPEEDRYITVYGQKYVPNDRDRQLFPLAFCRECGKEFYVVTLVTERSGAKRLVPRDFGRPPVDDDDDSEAGYLFLGSSGDDAWPDDPDAVIERLPDDWIDDAAGKPTLISGRAKYLPRRTHIKPDGEISSHGMVCYFVPTPFVLCPACGVSYDTRQRSDFGKLGSIGIEGRSTATTILSLSCIRHLRDELDLPRDARKLLSFTDNRQDASLQAGHFNDFVEVGMLRSALYRAALAAGPSGIRHDDLALSVFKTLDLPKEAYAQNPDIAFQGLKSTHEALINVLGYRLYRDLKRGWRISAPNLEQCGLLEIGYESLDEVCKTEDVWKGCHQALVSADPDTRERICTVLLDFMRRGLAIQVDYLDQSYQEKMKRQSSQYLVGAWAIGEYEKLEHASILIPRSRKPTDYLGYLYMGPRSGFGKFIRRHNQFPNMPTRLSESDAESVISDLLKVLVVGGIVSSIQTGSEAQGSIGYQVNSGCMRWMAGDGKRAYHDPIRKPRESTSGRPNRFFVDYYTTMARETHGMEAREHTAQVSSEDRKEREERFKDARLPILYCSPTMELGVDIARLNAVNMRNVPPTPANYAQRSGRAGRSGQPALVFTFCSGLNPHDQYFFRRPDRMVSGEVTPPRVDLTNEDLVRSHLHAIWLAETGLDLRSSLRDILQVEGESPNLEFTDTVRDAVQDKAARERALAAARHVLRSIEAELSSSDWYSDGWLTGVFDRAPQALHVACDRWRGLFKSATKQRDDQHRIIGDASRSASDKQRAAVLRREAESQLSLLLDVGSAVQSDFYSYRYLASEGFLPGYNFPRLPISAYIPGRHSAGKRDEFLSRPRFLAISEFGPKSIVYHEGTKYMIDRVIMPVTENADVPTSSAKICDRCGYIHPMSGNAGPDLCERCGTQLGRAFTQLFRMENVSTKQRDRISCDEEERFRIGFELMTALRFPEYGSRPSYRTAVIREPDCELFRLTYGHAATLWRINLGWLKRVHKDQVGFVLDLEQGRWQTDKWFKDIVEDDDEITRGKAARVVPYVEDRRNCLLVEPLIPLSDGQMASLQSALKSAIQVSYQLEESELAVESLPTRFDRRLIMLYEAAEGGAGVLRRLIDNPRAVTAVAREALSICHFDPDSGQDLKRAPHSKEDCEAACYDCLMSYMNQCDHAILDRHQIKDMLIRLSKASVVNSPAPLPAEDHMAELTKRCDSDLERRFLQFVRDRGYRMPTRAQVYIANCKTRADFVYDNDFAAVYIDGPDHQTGDMIARDSAVTEQLENAGYAVIRFGVNDDWDEIVKEYPDIFGRGR